ncbi:DHRS-12_like_SDR_c-like domain-containing protein isoform X2 [Poecilia latipinna]|uniref:DHRS-12_like_SDR_c-like domain-containing protein isoform X2 n=1 Tax=Poecilia formosa TaxID=48698 RepID=UPI000444257E|nr:PREDICTED: dehydrogenase/reductase SDR family member 12-like isoform X2 [Poecilia formosa]XP_014847244.1 PREDICTED: dehydrogenase/reductase SDR family member 12-like isoform X2 [Poecilia mexicana]XP_014898411.1 PREDICTED: dehydrogenase/reductase SDR family member 12-like isoform X2 [Poecilia latipinna]
MSLYRNSAWFLKGLTEFTKNGHLSASKRFVEKDLEVSVAGRSFMITGANSGVGKATAMAIAKRGGTIHMVCRNKDKAEEARADIVKETGNKEIYVHILDLSETKKVWEFAEGFKRKFKALNVLINNAGSIMSQRDVNAEGLEKSFAVNVLAVYILTKSLIPLLEKSTDPRVITVSSGGMLVQKLRIGNLQSERGRFDGTMVYAQHKRQQVVMTEQLAKTHANIHFSVMHPGWVNTPVANAMPDFHRSMKDSLRTPDQGADTVVWLAISEAATTNPSGRFYQDRKVVPTHLPLAWTHSSPLEEQKLVALLEDLAKTFQPH